MPHPHGDWLITSTYYVELTTLTLISRLPTLLLPLPPSFVNLERYHVITEHPSCKASFSLLGGPCLPVDMDEQNG